MGRQLTRGERNIDWIERHCRVPEGKLAGKSVKIRPWQRVELLKIYDNPAGTRRAILSFGRKNGKTAISAFMLLLHLCGPEALPNSQLISAAQSKEQAGLLFKLAAKIIRLSPSLSEVVRIRDTIKELVCVELGVEYKALSAEASTAYGLSPCFIVHDELGQVKGPRSELYDALETATGAQDHPISIIISTQAPTDGDLLSILIDDALAGNDPQVVVSLYTTPMEMDPFTDEAIRAANPAFGDFQNADEIRKNAEEAKRMPSREPSFRNLILNQRVEMNSPFVSRATWLECGDDVIEDFGDHPVYGGLDLSTVSDLTALVLISPINGVWHVKPTFWLPEDHLRDKAQRDRVPWDTWASQGHLETTPGRTIEYEWVAHRLRDLFNRYAIMKVGFDRYKFELLKAWLLRAGFSDEELDRFVSFGQGYLSMTPALHGLETDILNKKLVHGKHPVLSMCAANAKVDTDPAGNRKLTKQKSSGRIDGMVALTMAHSVGTTAQAEEPQYVEGDVLLW